MRSLILFYLTFTQVFLLNAQSQEKATPPGKVHEIPYPNRLSPGLSFIQTKKGWGLYSAESSTFLLQPEYQYLGQMHEFIVAMKNNSFSLFHPESKKWILQDQPYIEASFSDQWYVLSEKRWFVLVRKEDGYQLGSLEESFPDQGTLSSHSVRLEKDKVLLSARTFFLDRIPLVAIDHLTGEVKDSLDKNGATVFDHQPNEFSAEVYNVKRKSFLVRAKDKFRVNLLNKRMLLVGESPGKNIFIYTLIDEKGTTLFSDQPLSVLVNNPSFPDWLGLASGSSVSGLLVNERNDLIAGHHQINVTTPAGSGVLDLERMRWKVPPVYEMVFAPHMHDFYLAVDKGQFVFLHPDSTAPLFSVAGNRLSYEFGRFTEMTDFYGRLEIGNKIWLHHIDLERQKQTFDEYEPGWVSFPSRKTFRLDVQIEDSTVIFSVVAPKLISHRIIYQDDIEQSGEEVEQEYFERVAIFNRKTKRWIIASDAFTMASKQQNKWLLWSGRNDGEWSVCDQNGTISQRKSFTGSPEDYSALTGMKIDQVRQLNTDRTVFLDVLKIHPVVLRSGNKEGIFDRRSLRWIFSPEYLHIAEVPNTLFLVLFTPKKMIITDVWGKQWGEAVHELEFDYKRQHFIADDRVLVYDFPGSQMTTNEIRRYDDYFSDNIQTRFKVFTIESGRIILDYIRGKGELEYYDENGDVFFKDITSDTAYNKSFTRKLFSDGRIMDLSRFYQLKFLGGFYLGEQLDGTVLTDHDFNPVVSFDSDKEVLSSGIFVALRSGDHPVSNDVRAYNPQYAKDGDVNILFPSYELYVRGKKISLPDSLIVTGFADYSRVLFVHRSGFPFYLGELSGGSWLLIALPEINEVVYSAGPKQWFRQMQNSAGESVVGLYNQSESIFQESVQRVEWFFQSSGQVQALAMIDNDAILIRDANGKVLEKISAPFSDPIAVSFSPGLNVLVMDTCLRYFSESGLLQRANSYSVVNVLANEYRIVIQRLKGGKTEIVDVNQNLLAVFPGIVDTLQTETAQSGTHILKVKLKGENNYRWYTQLHTSKWEMLGSAPVCGEWVISPISNEFVQDYSARFILTENGELLRLNTDGSIRSVWRGVASLERQGESHAKEILIRFSDPKRPSLKVSLL